MRPRNIKPVALPGAIRPGFRCVHQEAPVIRSRAGSGEKLIDTVVLNLLLGRHRSLPLACIGRSKAGVAGAVEA